MDAWLSTNRLYRAPARGALLNASYLRLHSTVDLTGPLTSLTARRGMSLEAPPFGQDGKLAAFSAHIYLYMLDLTKV